MFTRPILAAVVAAAVSLGTGAAIAGAAPIKAGVPGTTPAGQATSGSRWILGYYPIYQRNLLPVGQIAWADLTHLVVGAVLPRADGSLDTSFYESATQGPKAAKKLTAAAKAHHVVPILMVGGAGAHDGFAAAAKNHLGKLVSRLLDVMSSDGFAGLDLDWEPVNANDQSAVKALVTALRQKAPHAILTMPVNWVTTTFPNVPAFYGVIAQKLNRIDVMTYGMAGAYSGWKTWHSSALKGAGSATPSDVAVNVSSFEAAGVPARKLGVGIGFYGMCWAGGVTGPRQAIGSSYVAADDNVMTYANIKNNYYSASAYHYDATAQAPYLGFSSPTGPQNCTFVSYENPRSIEAKGAYAKAHGLGSEIVWSINEGHLKSAPAANRDPLLAAAHRSFH